MRGSGEQQQAAQKQGNSRCRETLLGARLTLTLFYVGKRRAARLLEKMSPLAGALGVVDE